MCVCAFVWVCMWVCMWVYTYVSVRVHVWVQERIVYASQGIAENAMAKIKDGDVILTFGRLG